jgi:NCAIR mutase (PurE)-related protein
MMVFAVTFENLIEVAIVASVAGITVTGIFSFAILGTSRSLEARRQGRSAWRWTVVAFAGLFGVLLFAAAGIYAVAAR